MSKPDIGVSDRHLRASKLLNSVSKSDISVRELNNSVFKLAIRASEKTVRMSKLTNSMPKPENSVAKCNIRMSGTYIRTAELTRSTAKPVNSLPLSINCFTDETPAPAIPSVFTISAHKGTFLPGQLEDIAMRA